MEEIMKSCKCLMGALLSSVLLIGSVFAANTLSQNVLDGLMDKKYQIEDAKIFAYLIWSNKNTILQFIIIVPH